MTAKRRLTARNRSWSLSLAIFAVLPLLINASALAEKKPPDSTPRRIIATAPSNVEIVCALGACDRLVGVSPFATYPPEVHRLPKVGGLHDPDLEAFLSLKPDLVILRGRNVQVERLCDRKGIRLYEDRTDTLDTLYATIRDLGGILVKEDEAAELTASIHKKLGAIQEQAERFDQRPRVLLTLRSPDRLGSVTTVGNASYLHEVIELAGGENVFGDMDLAYPQVSLEELIARRPDVIVEAMPGEDIGPDERRKLLDQWRQVGALRAAREGNIHFLTEDYVLIPSPRVVLLAEKLHAIFADARASGEH